MFRPIPAIIRFSSERVLVFIRFMRLCNDGEISSSVVLIIANIKRRGWGGYPPPPSLHNRINLINTNTLSDENLTMAGIGRNM